MSVGIKSNTVQYRKSMEKGTNLPFPSWLVRNVTEGGRSPDRCSASRTAHRQILLDSNTYQYIFLLPLYTFQTPSFRQHLNTRRTASAWNPEPLFCPDSCFSYLACKWFFLNYLLWHNKHLNFKSEPEDKAILCCLNFQLSPLAANILP